MPTLRLARREDLGAINDIYNHYVLHSTCTYQTEPSTLEERQAWFEVHGSRHPVTVLEEEGRIIGWGALNKFHPRAAYGHTVENSVYLHHEQQGRGLGSVLLADLMERAAQLGHHVVIAVIDASQAPSVGLHAKFGFVQCGYFREVGFKFGQWLDVVYMQKLI